MCVRAEEGNNTTEKKRAFPSREHDVGRQRCFGWCVDRLLFRPRQHRLPSGHLRMSGGRSGCGRPPYGTLLLLLFTYLKNTLRVSRYTPQSSGHRRDRLPYRTGTGRGHDHDVRRCWCSGVGSISHTRIRLGIPVCTVPVLIYNPNWNISTDASNYRRRWDSQNILPVPTRCEIFVNSSWVGVVVVVRSLPRT